MFVYLARKQEPVLSNTLPCSDLHSGLKGYSQHLTYLTCQEIRNSVTVVKYVLFKDPKYVLIIAYRRLTVCMRHLNTIKQSQNRILLSTWSYILNCSFSNESTCISHILVMQGFS